MLRVLVVENQCLTRPTYLHPHPVTIRLKKPCAIADSGVRNLKALKHKPFSQAHFCKAWKQHQVSESGSQASSLKGNLLQISNLYIPINQILKNVSVTYNFYIVTENAAR